MPKFVIEREIPGAGHMSPEELRAVAVRSNDVLHELGPGIEWDRSYVAGDRIYCVYDATSEALIRAHARLSGFPADRITSVAAVIDPTTALQGPFRLMRDPDRAEVAHTRSTL